MDSAGELKSIFEIVPSVITVNKFRISNISIRPMMSCALVGIELFSEDNKLIQTKYLEISGEEYNQWTSDSPYLVNWICNKLNFALLE